jgi:transcriptional regulator with XRE-family HTH domain
MAQHNDTTVGRRIRRARRAADLSQSALGERLGVTRQTINTWENVPGADTSLSIERVTEIAAALDVTFAELVPLCDQTAVAS